MITTKFDLYNNVIVSTILLLCTDWQSQMCVYVFASTSLLLCMYVCVCVLVVATCIPETYFQKPGLLFISHTQLLYKIVYLQMLFIVLFGLHEVDCQMMTYDCVLYVASCLMFRALDVLLERNIDQRPPNDV